VLLPHPALQGITSGTPTVRVIVILEDGRPEILHTIWKIPAAGNVADNFWRPGNLLADIDAATGTVQPGDPRLRPQIRGIDGPPR
jgi:2-phospho-L-lactate transferase/gluconeogenesis factor (CofD/UPF0052 family)